ncbi:conserved hypothetical protein [Candidatus Magnetomoraceae bacterium gMMP-15]
MERIIINTGLNDFRLVDSIIKFDNESIKGVKSFSNVPVYEGIESLAQLGALHVRFINSFKKHAFLVKIKYCSMPKKQILNGRFQIKAKLISRSRHAFSYVVEAKKENLLQFKGEFLFATINYDNKFKKEILKNHYKEVFSSCTRDVNAGHSKPTIINN